MATPENKVKQFIDKHMKVWYPSAFRYAPPGVGYFGRNGMPDRMWWVKAGKVFCIPVAIEAKADNGEPTALQIKTLSDLARQGVISAIVVGHDLAHLRRIKDEIDRRISIAERVSELLGL